jgi:hypothetical protein
MQKLVISSESVGYAKQGTCIVTDNEPAPPTLHGYASHKGWKQVTNIAAVNGGGDFLIPQDQIMLVTERGYRKMPEVADQRVLSKLVGTKDYLVWYHHLMTQAVWKQKYDDYNTKEDEENSRPKKKKKA